MLGIRISLWFGAIYGAHGAGTPGIPSGDGSMDFSIITGDDTGLLALLEDI